MDPRKIMLYKNRSSYQHALQKIVNKSKVLFASNNVSNRRSYCSTVKEEISSLYKACVDRYNRHYPPFEFHLQYPSQYQHQHQHRQSNKCFHSSTSVHLAGHNKWSKIRHAKGKNDAQRGLLFSKISIEISAASRACGGDLSNIRLQAAISKAKSSNMPKDNIENAIKKGTAKVCRRKIFQRQKLSFEFSN